MSGKPRLNWPDDDELLAEASKHDSIAGMAEAMGFNRITLTDHLKTRGIYRKAQAELGQSTNGIRSEASPDLPVPWQVEDVIKAHGDDPDECVILRSSGTRWGDPGEPSHRLRVDWVRRQDIVQPVDPGSWTPPPKPKARKRKKDEPELVVAVGDHHCPLHDAVLHKLFCEYLADARPDKGVLLGDLLDFPTVSRFREREGFASSVNECLEAAFGVLSDYRHASPDTEWVMLPGNHDARLGFAIVDNAKAIHNVTAANDDVPALSLRRLLHLDDLGIELIEGEWDTAKVSLSRNLTARHGYTTVKTAGDKMLTSLSRSTVVGHSHRMSVTFRTEHDDSAEEATSTRVALEAGTMAEVKDGLGHTVDPNWHNGFIVINIWPGGDFHAAPAVFVPGRLMVPGGRRYEA